jgi:carboxymethylenebutenolidase
MQIKMEVTQIPVGDGAMRALVAAPAAGAGNLRYPGILLFSDIFQLSDPMRRTCARLAGYGFVVVAHEIFHRLEPAGTVLPQDDEGRARGSRNQLATPVAHFDEDARAALDFLAAHPMVAAGALGAGGFCIGGHLAYRAALQPDVKATVCFYPTWLHNGGLGQGQQADSLARAADIRGRMRILFGALDPLIPAEARAAITSALRAANVSVDERLYAADHGFVRDDRAAYDPECADQAFAEAVALYRDAFSPAS